jgi:post-segregation antitoxin (ccd killing protein)
MNCFLEGITMDAAQLKDYNHQYYLAHKKKAKRDKHQYYLAHKEEMIDNAKKYYKTHRNEKMAYQKQYQKRVYEENKGGYKSPEKRVKSKKHHAHLVIDEHTYLAAKEAGINVSRACERMLEEMIVKLTIEKENKKSTVCPGEPL